MVPFCYSCGRTVEEVPLAKRYEGKQILESWCEPCLVESIKNLDFWNAFIPEWMYVLCRRFELLRRRKLHWSVRLLNWIDVNCMIARFYEEKGSKLPPWTKTKHNICKWHAHRYKLMYYPDKREKSFYRDGVEKIFANKSFVAREF